MKTTYLIFSLFLFNTFAEEYKLPFTWKAKDTDSASEVKVKKADIGTNEDRALASEVEEEDESGEVRFWKFEQDGPTE